MEIDLVYFINRKAIKIFKSGINNYQIKYDKKNFSIKKNKLKRKGGIYNYVNVTLKILGYFPISLFRNCKHLISVSFKKNEIAGPTDFSNGFNGCVNLENFDISDISFDNVVSTNSMFRHCEKLKKINLTNLSLKDTVNADSMFEFCYNLESIKLCDDPAKKMASAQKMFSFTFIEKVDIRFFNEKINNISEIFSYCSNLKKVHLPFLSNDTNIEDAFFCTSSIVFVKRSMKKKLDSYVKLGLIEI